MTLSRQAKVTLVALLPLSACGQLDLDLRGLGGGFTTADAARNAIVPRPEPDARGVISYPTYQVAVARRGDTLADVATRLNLPAENLAAFNGVATDAPLRAGEVIALPVRVPDSGVPASGEVDVTTLAGQAIDNAPDTTPIATSALPPSGAEPVRHQVERGETAFTIARLYNVPVRSLAEWNGLGSDLAVREGQFLLIPIAVPPAADTAEVPEETVTPPGEGTATPEPPSASEPLPEEVLPEPSDAPVAVADVGETTKPVSQAEMAVPVQGKIIRDYVKGKNEGIDIQAAPGTAVGAADDGTVAAITESAEGVPIIVVRHDSNLLTVYANVDNVSVKKGDRVARGQKIANLRDAPNAYVHFEVRDGFDSVDPQTYLN